MSDSRRKVMWAVAVLCAVTGVGLLLVAFLLDLDRADRVASVAGALVALVSLALSVHALLKGPATGQGSAVLADGQGAVAARGNISGNAMGARSTARVAPAPVPPPVPPTFPGPHSPEVESRGTGAVAAGGDIAGNAMGDDSEVR